jgi:hypothetical protein
VTLADQQTERSPQTRLLPDRSASTPLGQVCISRRTETLKAGKSSSCRSPNIELPQESLFWRQTNYQ